jgi:hypothetical protein
MHSIPPENSTTVRDAPRKFLVRRRIDLEIVERVVGAASSGTARIGRGLFGPSLKHLGALPPIADIRQRDHDVR